jgi:hypothetical protein
LFKPRKRPQFGMTARIAAMSVRLARASTGPVGWVSMAQVSDGPQAALMNQHTDAGVDYRQAGRSDQTNLDTHRAAHDELGFPS